MKKSSLLVASLITLCMLSCTNHRLKYPEAEKTNVSDTYFGKTVHDPYRWLEDPASEKTRQWITAQNALTFSYLEKIPYRDKIKEHLTGIYNYAKMNTPLKKAGKFFYLKNSGLQNHDILYMQETADSEPVELLDPNKLDREGKISLGEFNISGDGNFLAFSVSQGGSDWREIYIKNILTGEMLNDSVKWVKFSSIAWHRDGFFYSRYPRPEDEKSLTDMNKNHRVYYHKTGTSQAEDMLIFETAGFPDRILTARVTDDEKFLIIEEAESTYGSRLHIKKMEDPGAEFVLLMEDFSYENHIVGNIENQILLLTNRDATRYKLQSLNFNNTPAGLPIDLIPENENLLEKVNIAGDKLIAKYLVDAHAELRVFDLSGKYLYQINLPPLGDVSDLSSSFNDPEVFYTYTSYTTPPEVFRYNSATNTSELFFKPETSFDENGYTTSLEFCTSKDGTRVPLYITCKKEIEKNGKNPLMLYGYGGFNISLQPRFSPYIMYWLENGGIFVNANIRGGGEYGEEWHKAGTKLQKQNVFDDFIAAAEFMINQKYTNPEKILIEGRSNGGLLIGAVVNQRPELFKVALPAVGVMDMLRFSRFTIGWAWESDYGSVNNEKEFESLLSISPLHNIKTNIEYPAILVTTAERDDRVVPAHSFKYMATLQEKEDNKNPLLIRIQTDAGHGAGKPVNVQIDERADILAFTFYNLRITPVFK
ncbi:MAG: S9 family peptidase [Bacteroidales bacterium]|nr:S9 family peptidase [Bacteroidales bacterium]